MSFAGKTAAIFGTAAFLGGTAALWLSFGGSVYAAYLAGAIMRCF